MAANAEGANLHIVDGALDQLLGAYDIQAVERTDVGTVITLLDGEKISTTLTVEEVSEAWSESRTFVSG